MTAGAAREDKLYCLATGASACLPKPVDHDLLLETIGAQLSLRRVTELAPQDQIEANGGGAVDLVVPPAAEMAALYRLEQVGNMKSIRERDDYLEALDPAYALFARRLQLLAPGYQSRTLAAFVGRYQDGTDAPAQS